MIGESLLQFAATIEQLAQQPLVGLLQYFIHREAAYARVREMGSAVHSTRA
jgi:hypothetical protein